MGASTATASQVVKLQLLSNTNNSQLDLAAPPILMKNQFSGGDSESM